MKIFCNSILKSILLLTLRFILPFLVIGCTANNSDKIIGQWAAKPDGINDYIWEFKEGNKIILNDKYDLFGPGIYTINTEHKPPILTVKLDNYSSEMYWLYDMVDDNKIELEHIGNIKRIPVSFSKNSFTLLRFYNKEDVAGNTPTILGIQQIIQKESAFARIHNAVIYIDTIKVLSTKTKEENFTALVTIDFICGKSALWSNEGHKDPIPNYFELYKGRNSIDVNAVFEKYDDGYWHLINFIR